MSKAGKWVTMVLGASAKAPAFCLDRGGDTNQSLENQVPMGKVG